MPYSPVFNDLITISNSNRDERQEVGAAQELITYGLGPIDSALYGIDTLNGEYIGVQGPEKNRKSTFIYNVLLNIGAQYHYKSLPYYIVIDSLESAITPLAVTDIFVSMSATRRIIAEILSESNRAKWPDVKTIKQLCGNNLGISKEFLWWGNWNLIQSKHIKEAKDSLRKLPLMVFAPSLEAGNTRNLSAAMSRWHKLYTGEGLDDFPQTKGREARIFVCDNIQLYGGFGADKFRQQEAVVSAHAEFLVTHPGSILFDVSQISKTSQVTSRLAPVEMYAKGGGALAAEVTVLFETIYDDKNHPERQTIGVPETRKRPPPTVIQELDPDSGAYLRPPYLL